jgi:hypothetical protein
MTKTNLETLEFTHEGDNIVCQGVRAIHIPQSFWQPEECDIEFDSITINGEEVDWEDEDRLPLIIDEAYRLAII